MLFSTSKLNTAFRFSFKSTYDLSDCLGCSFDKAMSICNGTIIPTDQEVEKISNLLNVTPDYFLIKDLW